ncbi:zinc carboxypeptidase [Moesziomyces antarcticus T-34]|uniref:Inactive metallocarboxypeptidase ECM14 n=1 Tax=Pseudozyma antarctica (strain T-34) TaxID=1151754 RepID=M9LSM8_PSEA3|nr:zinc carboxypeptidase [Moesziomyces antarcticus T-34]
MQRTLAARLLLLAASLISTATAVQQPFDATPRITFTSAAESHGVADFTGQQVVRFTTASHAQHQALLQRAHALGLDVWAAHRGSACSTSPDAHVYGCVDVRLASEDGAERDWMAQLMQPFPQHKRPHAQTMIEDVQQLVAAQRSEVDEEEEEEVEAMREDKWHRDYHTFDEITAYMRMLEHSYPTHAQLVQLGTTHEGRPILGLKISDDLPVPTPDPQPEPQPDPPANTTASARGKLGIVVTGGQHAREWVSTSSALYFASDLLAAALGVPSNSSSPVEVARRGKKRARKVWSKKQARLMLSSFSITVVPVSNPDGYVYSWDKNRMWRKNRQPNHFPSGLFCKGVDVNRNYDYGFASSSNACSEMYSGSAPFTSAEARAIATYVEDARNGVVGFFDLHSYGQLMMYPFSADCALQPADEEDLLEASLGAIKAVKAVDGKAFTAGKICEVYAVAGGNAVDWAYAASKDTQGQQKAKVKWSFSIELRDGGTYGFLLPKKQIVPAASETSAALAYILSFIQKKSF